MNNLQYRMGSQVGWYGVGGGGAKWLKWCERWEYCPERVTRGTKAVNRRKNGLQ